MSLAGKDPCHREFSPPVRPAGARPPHPLISPSHIGQRGRFHRADRPDAKRSPRLGSAHMLPPNTAPTGRPDASAEDLPAGIHTHVFPSLPPRRPGRPDGEAGGSPRGYQRRPPDQGGRSGGLAIGSGWANRVPPRSNLGEDRGGCCLVHRDGRPRALRARSSAVKSSLKPWRPPRGVAGSRSRRRRRRRCWR